MKAGIVAQQVNLGDWLDVCAATPTSIGQRLIVWVAVRLSRIIGSIDISTAFLHARVPDDIFLFASKLASGVGSDDPCDLYWVRQALYGFRVSPRLFQECFATRMKKNGLRRSQADPQLFIGPHGELISAHVDDVLCVASPEHFDNLLQTLKE